MADAGFAGRSATAMLPAKDIARARKWYEDKLGITPNDTGDYGSSYDLGGLKVYLYTSDFAGTAKHTLITFPSDDLEADMKALRAKGVKFIDYDLPGPQDRERRRNLRPRQEQLVRRLRGQHPRLRRGDVAALADPLRAYCLQR